MITKKGQLCAMKLSFVIAVSENRVIGVNNQLPWHLPEDLKFFKKTTLGKPIIMGKNTFLSLGKALPGRMNIILSQSMKVAPDNTLLFSSMNGALNFLEKENVQEACIIGGGLVFKESRDLVDEIFLTRVHTEIPEGTVFFDFPEAPVWRRVWSEAHQKDTKHAFDFTFEKWERVKA